MKLDYKALHESGHPPRFFGGGFIELYLGDTTHLHIWNPDVLPPHWPTPHIHDLRFSLKTKVLYGAIHHATYEVTMDENGAYGLYEVFHKGEGDDEDDDAPAPKLLGKCSVEQVDSTLYQQNAAFEFPRRRYHTSYAKGLAVTVIERSQMDSDYNSKIAAPLSEGTPTADADPSVSEKRLWEVTRDALAILADEGVTET